MTVQAHHPLRQFRVVRALKERIAAVLAHSQERGTHLAPLLRLHSGNIAIDRSVITNNVGGSWYPTYPQISNPSDTPIDVSTSIIR
jgi:hypothetical protein